MKADDLLQGSLKGTAEGKTKRIEGTSKKQGCGTLRHSVVEAGSSHMEAAVILQQFQV